MHSNITKYYNTEGRNTIIKIHHQNVVFQTLRGETRSKLSGNENLTAVIHNDSQDGEAN